MILQHIKDTKKYTMNLDTANETLQNIFEACDQNPNNVPLEILISQKDIIVRPITIMTYFCHVILFILLLLPFWMNQPKYEFTTVTTYDSFYVKEEYIENNNIYIRTNLATIDFSQCYIVDVKGNRKNMSDFNTITNTLSFPLLNTQADLYITDTADHTLHLLLTSK